MTEPVSVKQFAAHRVRWDVAPREEIERLSNSVVSNPLFILALDSMPCPAIVLNEQRQIVYANHRMLVSLGTSQEEILGKRLGEAVGCIHVDEGPSGCGTSDACTFCGATNAILECQQTREMVSGECRITIDAENENALDFEVVTTSMNLDCGPMTICALRDISSEKRRRILERVFFHDILNTAGGLQGIAQMLLDSRGEDPQAEIEYRQMVAQLAECLVTEIQDHRQLLAAESGELRPEPTSFSLTWFLQGLRMMCASHQVARRRNLVITDYSEFQLESDVVLLRRVLVNMLKNAFESSPEGGAVTLSVEKCNGSILFQIHNDAVMPNEVRLQIFQRSFSTKADYGRGIGTYSMKLFGERYLNGKVWFTSRDGEGTIFSLELPISWPAKNR